MKRLFAIVLILPLLLIVSCKKTDTASNPVSGSETGTVIINGEVIDFTTGSPIANAAIKLYGLPPDTTVIKHGFTDANGKYTIEFSVTGGIDLKVVAQKEGYTTDTTNVFAVAGRTLTATKLLLKSTGTGGGAGTVRKPASIYLASTSVPNIGIKGAGSLESVQLVFTVVDSSGVPLDLENAVNISFGLGASPGSGASLYPAVVRSNASGNAAVVLTSGTKAGVVQIVASVTSDGKTITSIPVPVSIHGGLPDLTHFSVVPAKLNIPGYNKFGVFDEITAYVGDKYSNPVRPGIAVYFNTDGGIIGGSALTSEMGVATVSLYSANPLPTHPTFGPGFATITGSTIDENKATIQQSCLVLFSGLPFLTVSPTSFDIPNRGSQTFIYTVMDQNSNPLTEGTAISVDVEGKDYELQGDKAVTLPDTQSRSWTSFSFTISDKVDTAAVNPLRVLIKSTGGNGKSQISISGVVR